MSKVIVERPRHRSRANNDDKGELKLWQREKESHDYELVPRRGSSSRHWRRNDWKELNEFLAPLRRFLDSHVGKHWDKVYSEIRSQVNPNNTVQMHIMQHLIGRFGYVDTNVKAWPDGTFTTSDGKELRAEWFVNPKTGCLARNMDSPLHGGNARFRKRYGRYQDLEPKYVRFGDRNLRQLDGIWFEFKLGTLPPPAGYRKRSPSQWYITGWGFSGDTRPDPPVFDAYLRCWPTYKELHDAHGRTVDDGFIYAVSKQQLSSKDIKRYKLRPADNRIPDSPTRR